MENDLAEKKEAFTQRGSIVLFLQLSLGQLQLTVVSCAACQAIQKIWICAMMRVSW